MSTPDNFNSRGVPNRVQIDNQSLPIIITLLLLIFFFVGFLAVYICRCVMEYFTGVLLRRNNPSGNLIRQRGAATHGIDPSILSSFPTFEYSKVKDLKQDKGGLECAVCLTEFEDSDMVRLLNVCNHAFHPECIDLWLESHTTCPVCRRDLSDPLQESPEKTPEVIVTIPNAIQPTSDQGDESRHDDNSSTTTRRVSFKDDDILRVESNIIGSMSVQCSGADHVEERFSRSHSTGHSLMILSGDHERYTLRLTEDVMKRITRGHNVTGSCTTFEEFSGDITIEKNGLAEVSGISAGDNLTSVDSL